MTLLQPRTRTGRFSTFGHAAPTVALPAARYPSELPFRRDRFASSPAPVQLLTRRHLTPIRDAIEAAGLEDLHEVRDRALKLTAELRDIQARLR
jgi:hypothetical protein